MSRRRADAPLPAVFRVGPALLLTLSHRSLDPSELTQGIREGLRQRMRAPAQQTDSIDPLALLRSGGERRKSKAAGENDEPDQPHGHLGGGWLAGSLAERCYGHQHGGLLDEHWKTRRCLDMTTPPEKRGAPPWTIG